MILQLADWEGFVYAAHVLGEADTAGVRPLGGNVLEVPDGGWAALSAEQRREIGRFTVGLTPPGETGGDAVAPVVGRRPAAPLSQQPLPYPPETGPGSGKATWQRYATAHNIDRPADASRDEIIAAVKAQRPDLVPTPAAPEPDSSSGPLAPEAPHPDAPPVMTTPGEGDDQEAHTGAE